MTSDNGSNGFSFEDLLPSRFPEGQDAAGPKLNGDGTAFRIALRGIVRDMAPEVAIEIAKDVSRAKQDFERQRASSALGAWREPFYSAVLETLDEIISAFRARGLGGSGR